MKTFSTSIVNSSELQTSATRIDQIILSDIPTDVFIKKVEPVFRPHLNDLTVALGRINDSTNIRILFNKDTIRDNRFKTLRDYCKAYAGDKNPTLATAGASLVNVFKELGWSMYAEGYAVESAKLDALIDRFEKTPASTALTTIGATERFTDLKAAQVDFETTYNTKIDALAKEIYPKIGACRLAIARYLNGILSYVDLMAEIDGGVYNTAAGKIDEVITEIEGIARNRQTRNENKDKKDTDDSTTTTK